MAFGVGGTGEVSAQSGQGISGYLGGWGKTAYNGWYDRQVAANTPSAPEFSNGGADGSDLLSQMKFLMGLSGGSGSGAGLNYALYTPQEMAQRGLSLNGANRGALDAQGNYLNTQQGYIGQQADANTLKNQLAGQDIASKAAQAKLKAAQDTHTAQGQFAANGAISSEAARQALGSTPNAWKDTQPWMAPSGVAGMGGTMGDIKYGLQNTNQDLYRQLQGIQSDYGVAQGGLYSQLAQLGVQRAQLNPQYMQLDQGNDAYNRLLGGNYNTNVSPELRALMSALSQAGG